MKGPLRNVAQSVHARLLNRAQQRDEDMQNLLQRYAAERFLYRLGVCPHRDQFVLKGAMLFALWGSTVYRPTRDLDLTGYGRSDAETVLATFREICEQPVEDDGLVFNTASLTAEPIRDDHEYNGLRIRFSARLGQGRIPAQVDIGFDNAVYPPPADVDYPALLDSPRPWIRAYPQEGVVAEKLHAMVQYGETNTRYKDFYDLYVLAKLFAFDGTPLAHAIATTFKQRQTPIGAEEPAALTPRFYADGPRADRWRSYLTRGKLPGAPADLDAVGELLRVFLGLPWSALANGNYFRSRWEPGGPWR